MTWLSYSLSELKEGRGDLKHQLGSKSYRGWSALYSSLSTPSLHLGPKTCSPGGAIELGLGQTREGRKGGWRGERKQGEGGEARAILWENVVISEKYPVDVWVLVQLSTTQSSGGTHTQ